MTKKNLPAGYKKTNHLLHFILTILTGTVWSWVWLIVALRNRSHNRKLLAEQASTNTSSGPHLHFEGA